MNHDKRDDVTHIIHAHECGCAACRNRKGESFRIVVEPEIAFNPLDKPWYLETPKYKYKEYRLRRKLIGDDAIEYIYEFHHEGKI